MGKWTTGLREPLKMGRSTTGLRESLKKAAEMASGSKCTHHMFWLIRSPKGCGVCNTNGPHAAADTRCSEELARSFSAKGLPPKRHLLSHCRPCGADKARTSTAPLPKHAQLGVDGFELFFVFLRISFLEGAPLRGRLQSCHMKSAGGGVASVGRLTCLCTSEEGGVARRGEGSPREGRSGSNERQVKKCQALNPTSRTTINLPHCRSLRQRLFNVGLAARVKFFVKTFHEH